ncbi:hypothetical protein OSJ19_25520, partial [Mycobacterium ulcerans]
KIINPAHKPANQQRRSPGLLRRIFTVAGIFDRYELLLIDTGGRTGSLEALAMHLGDVVYAPITPTLDAVRKAKEARNRVESVQRTHPFRWCGVVLSGVCLINGVSGVFG